MSPLPGGIPGVGAERGARCGSSVAEELDSQILGLEQNFPLIVFAK